mgnify:FL=1
MYRLWNGYLLNPNPITDIPNRIRLDDFEMRPDIQQKVLDCWNRLTNENLEQYADIQGYWQEFYQLFGFKYENINYDLDTSADRPIPSMSK